MSTGVPHTLGVHLAGEPHALPRSRLQSCPFGRIADDREFNVQVHACIDHQVGTFQWISEPTKTTPARLPPFIATSYVGESGMWMTPRGAG